MLLHVYDLLKAIKSADYNSILKYAILGRIGLPKIQVPILTEKEPADSRIVIIMEDSMITIKHDRSFQISNDKTKSTVEFLIASACVKIMDRCFIHYFLEKDILFQILNNKTSSR
ncbi:hypothetical protein V1478_007378 [Vespula squamosa]|uniref:Uncharacterized protein n=1 Tax=Vespula squamosa TaxID=30214 RepID=A0ABD2B306_VESSQ